MTTLAPSETSTSRHAAEREECRYLWPPLILSIVLLWFVPMGTGLGLDESGNWWVIKDGFRAMLHWSRLWPGGALFNALVIAARSFGGDSDVVMRIPALLASLGAVYLLYRLGRRLFGPLAAMFSCLVFVTMRGVVYEASTVRPYSLALLLVIGAILCLVNWLDTGRSRYAVSYVLLASLTLYATFLYAIMFLVHAVYALVRIRVRESRVGTRSLIAAWSASAVLLLPLASEILASFADRSKHTFLTIPNVETAVGSVIPTLLAGSLALALLLGLALRWPLRFSSVPFSAEARLVAVWALMPPAILFTLARTTNLQLFTDRYYLENAPGLALAAGILFSCVDLAAMRRLIASTIAVCAVLLYGVDEHFMRGVDDFRGAVAAVRKQVGDSRTPVVVITGFVEGQYLSGVLDPALSEVLFSPVLRYQMPGELVAAPMILDEEAEDYLERTFVTKLQDSQQFLLVGYLPAERYRAWLESRGRSLGFTDRLYGAYGNARVYLFERGP
jgi:hypothetical protein